MTTGVIWMIIAIAAFSLDLLTSSFFFVSFSIGAIAALVADARGASAAVQVTSFLGLSALSIVLGYPWVKKSLRRAPKLRPRERNYIGRTLTLEEDLEDKAQIKIDGLYWTVKNEGPAIKRGEKAQVIGIEGNKIVITKHWEE